MKAWEDRPHAFDGACLAQGGEVWRSIRGSGISGSDGCMAAALAAWVALCGLDLTGLWWSDAPPEEKFRSRAVALVTLAAAFAALLVGCTWSSCHGDKRRCLWARGVAHLVLNCGAALWLMLHEVGGRETQAVVGVMVLMVFVMLAFWGALLSGLLPASVMCFVPAALVRIARQGDGGNLPKDPGLVVIHDSEPTSSKGRWQPLFVATDWDEPVEQELQATNTMRSMRSRKPSWPYVGSHTQDTFSPLDNTELLTLVGKQVSVPQRRHTSVSTLNSALSDVSCARSKERSPTIEVPLREGPGQASMIRNASRKTSRSVTIPRLTVGSESALSGGSSGDNDACSSHNGCEVTRLNSGDITEITQALFRSQEPDS